MSTQIDCPLEGCGVSFQSVGSVKAHVTKKDDAVHKGLSGPNVIDDDGNLVSQAVSQPDESDENSDDESVIGEGPEPETDSVTDSTPDEASAGPACPECGGSRYFDASEHTDYKFGCADCSDDEEWVVFDE